MPSLKEWRARRLLTVRGLAKLAGVAPATVYKVENGLSVPQFRVIQALSQALGVDAEMLPAMQTIFHDREHLSRLVLPIVPR